MFEIDLENVGSSRTRLIGCVVIDCDNNGQNHGFWFDTVWNTVGYLAPGAAMSTLAPKLSQTKALSISWYSRINNLLNGFFFL